METTNFTLNSKCNTKLLKLVFKMCPMDYPGGVTNEVISKKVRENLEEYNILDFEIINFSKDNMDYYADVLLTQEDYNKTPLAQYED